MPQSEKITGCEHSMPGPTLLQRVHKLLNHFICPSCKNSSHLILDLEIKFESIAPLQLLKNMAE
uniref:Uncharacterized protein n=1 Tax=Rhizophora mucronata TaxID=61149 RepID=A0A2P2IXF4_RHIMU